MVVGCIKDNQRLNGSYCCDKYFNPTKFINAFGSCVSTSGREPIRESMAVNLKGFVVLVRMNADRIGEIIHILHIFIISSFGFYIHGLNFPTKAMDPTIVSAGFSEKSGIVFSVSDSSVFNYGSLLSHANYVTPGTSVMIGISLTKVTRIFFERRYTHYCWYLKITAAKQTDNSAMKGALLAPYTCSFNNENIDMAKGFQTYSKENCYLTAIQKVYNEYFGCNTVSIPPLSLGKIDIQYPPIEKVQLPFPHKRPC